MSEEEIYNNLVKICGSKSLSKDSVLLERYSRDLSFVEGKIPKFIVWPKKAEQIEKILKLANILRFSVIPVSSRSSIHYHGDTLPQRDNTIIVDLSKMDKILNIDRKNRVIMVEPGVVFGQLLPILQKKGLRVLLPLHPRNSKSVLTTALERVPVTIPRYQWDSSDPLLCTEVVFGTGDLFRTGTAAGPGTLKQQKKSGQAQTNPMGPTQFSPFRLIQGAQGSLGIVTWATLKLELMPTIQKVVHLQSDNLEDLLKLQQLLLKYRLADELLILNKLNLACLVRQKPEDIKGLSKVLSKWNLIYVLGGRGKLANDKISYQEGDIEDIMTDLKLGYLKKKSMITDKEILNALKNSTSYPWRRRLTGSFQDIFFISNFEKIIHYISLAENEIQENIGFYIQAINQGTSYHCEIDIYYNQENQSKVKEIEALFNSLSVKLINEGAFFNRPYGLWAKEVFNHHQESTQFVLKKVKKIFDPNNVLNPGVLCFDS
jgi:hypothetical protein